jgi:hypothetical protein
MNINLNDFLYIIATSWIPESGDLFIFCSYKYKNKEAYTICRKVSILKRVLYTHSFLKTSLLYFQMQ